MAKTKTLVQIKKSRDVTLHVRQVSAGGETFLDLRDVYNDTGDVGRGVIFQVGLLDQVIEALEDAKRLVGNARSTAGEIEGQQTLPGMADV